MTASAVSQLASSDQSPPTSSASCAGLVHHALGEHPDGLLHVAEVLVEGRRRRPGLPGDVGHLHRAPRRGGEQLDGGVEQPLAGLAPALAGDPPVGGGHLLGRRRPGRRRRLSPGTASWHGRASVAGPVPKTQVTVRIRCRDGADAGPPAHPRAAGPAPARHRRRHGARARGRLRGGADARRRGPGRRGHGHGLPLLHEQGPPPGRHPRALGRDARHPHRAAPAPRRAPRRPRPRRPRPCAARHGPPAQAGRRGLHLALLARPGARSAASSRSRC